MRKSAPYTSSLSQRHAPLPALEKLESTYRKTVLPSGIRVVSEDIPHVRSVSIGLWVDTGSRHENEATNGISHFIEHMVFKGTRKRSVREIAESIESVGGYLNAFTGKEHTCFYARVLDEHASLALDVISDMILNATFPNDELEKEKGVVIEELKNAEDDPDDNIHDLFEKELFGSHPLGYPVIGSERNLRSFTRKDLRSRLETRYIPSNFVVAAAGRIHHDRLCEFVSKYLGRTTADGQRNVAAVRPRSQKSVSKTYDRAIQQAHICLGTTGYSIKHRRRYPLLVLNTLLGDGMSSRLFQNIREKFGFAYSVFSFANMMSDTGTVGAYIGTDGGHVEKCIELIWKEFDALKSRSVPKSELRRTQSQLKGSMMLSLESIPNRMMRLGSSELYFGELTSLDEVIRKVDAVTQDDLREVACDLFEPQEFATVVFRPTDKQSGEDRKANSAGSV